MNSSFGTNPLLFTTINSLSGFTTGISGYLINNNTSLTVTGSLVLPNANLSGAGSNVVTLGANGLIIISGTGAGGGGSANIQITGSANQSSINLTGVGSVIVTLSANGIVTISGSAGGTGSFDPLGTAANTGQVLYGYLTGFSGSLGGGSATVAQLNSLSGFVTGVSGFLENNNVSLMVTGSTTISSANLTGAGTTSITLNANGQIVISGLGSGIGSFDPIGTAQNTGQILTSLISGVSGYLFNQPFSALNGQTGLNLNTNYYDNFGPNRSVAFVGTPQNGSFITLLANITGQCTLQFPQSNRIGQAGTVTGLTLNLGNQELSWIYANTNWWLADSTSLTNNVTASRNPTVTDDYTSGYAPGSLWINISTNAPYLNMVNTVSSAIWFPLSSGSGGGGAGGSNVQVTGSATIVNVSLTGAGSTTILYQNGFVIISGGTGAVGGSFDPLGTAANTGQQLYNIITGLSGQANTNYATASNLTLTGAILLATIGNYALASTLTGLSGFTTGISGFLQNELNTTNINLTNSGVAIENQINSLSGFVTGISGYLTTHLSGTSGNFTSVIVTGSSILPSVNFTGIGGTNVFSSGGFVFINSNSTGGSSIITGYTGAVINFDFKQNVPIISGSGSLFVPFSNNFGAIPWVIPAINNNSGNAVLGVNTSGISTSGFTVIFSATPNNANYSLSYIASTGTGYNTLGGSQSIIQNSISSSNNTSISFDLRYNIPLTQGIENQSISFSSGFQSVPYVIYSIVNNSGNPILTHQLSGVTTGGFNVILSNAPLNSNYTLNYLATTGSGINALGGNGSNIFITGSTISVLNPNFSGDNHIAVRNVQGTSQVLISGGTGLALTANLNNFSGQLTSVFNTPSSGIAQVIAPSGRVGFPPTFYHFFMNASWNSMPAGITVFPIGAGTAYTMIDLTSFTGVNLFMTVSTSGSQNSKVFVGYSGNASNPINLATGVTASGFLNVTSNNTQYPINTNSIIITSGFQPIAPLARGLVYLGIFGSGGNGLITPSFGSTYMALM